MPIGRYRIKNPTIGLFLGDGRAVTHMVPEGAIVVVDAVDIKRLAEDTLVRLTWDGKEVMMFAQHLRSRAERAD